MPKRKRRSVAARTRHAVNSRRRPRATNHRRRRQNPGTRIVVVPSRKLNPHRRRARKNPMVMGQQMNAGKLAKTVAGVIVGVGATKMIVPMLPSTVTSSPIFQFAAAVAVAVGAGWAAGKVSPDLGGAVLIGGLAEAASMGLNNFLPVSQYTGLSGLGTYVPASFPLPSNPIPQNMPGTGQGLSRVYPGAYGRRAA